jgi:hypothetical protein
MTPDQARSLANDISCAIATLQAVADELMTAYPDSDYDRDNAPEPKATEPIITEADVRKVLAGKSRDGFTAQVKALLTKHGVSKVSELKPEQYATILAETEGIR